MPDAARNEPTSAALEPNKASAMNIQFRSVVGLVVLFGVVGLLASNRDSFQSPAARAQEFTPNYRTDGNTAGEDRLPQLKREGTKLVSVIGRFVSEGDTATFVTKEGMELGGLPNLSLERVVTTLKSVDDPQNVWWSINGTVTEFTGKNYVLISRAVFKAASPPPPPQAISAAK